MPVGALLAVLFVFWVTNSGLRHMGGAIDVIILLGIAVLVYTLQSLFRRGKV